MTDESKLTLPPDATPKPAEVKSDSAEHLGLHPHEKLKIDDKYGIFAKVDRMQAGGPAGELTNDILRTIGKKFKDDIPQLKELTYLGSTAVHIYAAETLGQVMFVSQPGALGNTHPDLANRAMRQWEGDILVYYGKKRKRQRSGV